MRLVFITLLFCFSIQAFTQVPVINSFIPLKGVVGTTVTINGSGFNTSSNNNIVYFGSVKAQVNSASASQLIVTVPIGATYAPITIVNTGSVLIGSSLNYFTPTYAVANKKTILAFEPKIDFNVGVKPVSETVGDFDGDGKLDIAVINNSNNTLSVLRNIGTGGAMSFATKVDFNTGSNPQTIHYGDLDGDGKLDLVVTNLWDNTISIYRNTSTIGTISFAAKVDYPTDLNPAYAAIGDFDNDGKSDIAVANYSGSLTSNDGTVSIYKNISSGSGTINFATRTNLITGQRPLCIALGDLDGDSKLDLAVTNWETGSISVFRNLSSLGNIAFTTKSDLTTNQNPLYVAMGDLDGDAKLDIAVASSNRLSVLKNRSSFGNISFDTKQDFIPEGSPVSVDIDDLNGDGKPDITVVQVGSNGNQISLFNNTSVSGSIDFDEKVSLSTGLSPYQVMIADLNGDGKSDIVTVNSESNTISILKSSPSFVNALPPPIITSFVPLSANIGTNITINGSGFNAVADNNMVFFGGVKSKVIAASATKLIVEVPLGASYGPIAVMNKGTLQTGVSNAIFNPIFYPNKSSLTYKDFATFQSIRTGEFLSSTRDVETADIDGDGKLEMLTVNTDYDNPMISILRNKSKVDSVSFDVILNIVTNKLPRKLKLADIDQDGKLDLIIIDGFNEEVSIYKNNSTIGSFAFGNKISYSIGTSPSALSIADVDGDGLLDVLVSIWDNQVAVYRNKGNLLFDTKINYAIGFSPSHIVMGDLNGDNKPDILVANYDGRSFSVLKNNSTSGLINFIDRTDFVSGIRSEHLSIGDLNEDGKLDVVVVNKNDKTISVFKNTSSTNQIQFENQLVYKAGSETEEAAIGDMNGDGKPDIVVANYGNLYNFESGEITLLKNISANGNLSFDDSQTIRSFGLYSTMDLADMDGDGKLDIVTIQSGNAVSIGLNKPSFPTSIVSFTPMSAANGAIVTIEGINFNAVLANNIVYFGNLKAAIVRASSTQLVVKVPAGASFAPITVLNIGKGLTAVSKLNFTPQFSPPKTIITNNDFLEKQEFTTGRAPSTINSGDFDGDGLLDIVTANYFGNSISILRKNTNSGIIGYDENLDIETGLYPQFVEIADMNGDGKLDLLVANSGDNNFKILINQSNGIGNIQFDVKYSYTTGGNPISLAVSDLNLDGKLDVVVVNQSDNNLSVYLNNGTNDKISFGSSVKYSVGLDPKSVVIGDVNNDSYNDIVVNNQGARSISVLNNNGSGGLLPKVDYITGLLPSSIAVGDLNNDGKLDLIVTHQATTTSFSNVSVLKNTGNAFVGQVTYPTDEKPYAVKLGDLDGDGKIDITVANNGSSNISLYKNISTSTDLKFNEKVTIAAMTNPASIHIADADGDGRPDLITPATTIFGASIGISKNVYPLTITANNQKICSGSISAFDNQNFTVTGLLNNDRVANVKMTSTGSTASSLAGTYPIIPSDAVGTGLNNYRITYVNGTLTKEAPIPSKRLDPIDVSINVNNKVQLNARNFGVTGTQYSWTPFYNLNSSTIANPIATLNKQEEYRVEMKTPAGCVTVDTVLTRVHADKSIYVPNAFSPNGDGINDVLKVKLVGFSKLNNFVIYNRYRWFLFSTNDVNKGWNGTSWYRLEAGTYYWSVSATDMNGQIVQKTGSVLLMK